VTRGSFCFLVGGRILKFWTCPLRSRMVLVEAPEPALAQLPKKSKQTELSIQGQATILVSTLTINPQLIQASLPPSQNKPKHRPFLPNQAQHLPPPSANPLNPEPSRHVVTPSLTHQLGIPRLINASNGATPHGTWRLPRASTPHKTKRETRDGWIHQQR